MMLNKEATDAGTGGGTPRGATDTSGLNLNIYSSTQVRRPMLFSMKTAPAFQMAGASGKETVDIKKCKDCDVPALQICERVDDLIVGACNSMIIIFDLTTTGSLVSSGAVTPNGSEAGSENSSSGGGNGSASGNASANGKGSGPCHNAKDIYRIHLSLPSTLVKRPKFHFEKILHTVIDDSKRLKLLNLIDNCNRFLFFDGTSTLSTCSLTTFWLIKKFNAFLHDKLGKSNIELFILEKMDTPFSSLQTTTTANADTTVKTMSAAATATAFSSIGQSSDFLSSDKKTFQGKMNLTVKVLPRSNEKMFIQSIKKDTVHYSPTSLRKFFKFKIPENLSQNDPILPNWLKQFADKDKNDVLLQKLLSNFEFLESLELERLERGLTVEQQRQQQHEQHEQQ